MAGTTGTTQPIFPTTTNDATVTDGTVKWQVLGVDITYDDAVQITKGAGNDVHRFQGPFRGFNYALQPRGVGRACFGYLALAHEFEKTQGNGNVAPSNSEECH